MKYFIKFKTETDYNKWINSDWTLIGSFDTTPMLSKNDIIVLDSIPYDRLQINYVIDGKTVNNFINDADKILIWNDYIGGYVLQKYFLVTDNFYLSQEAI